MTQLAGFYFYEMLRGADGFGDVDAAEMTR